MYIAFNDDRITEISERCHEEGIGDEILYKHNMTAVHTEILGQFLDQTSFNADDMMIFFEVGLAAFRKWVSDGLAEMREENKIEPFWEKYKSSDE